MISYLHKAEKPSLSILICSLEKRTAFLRRLSRVIMPQCNNEVEVIVNIDNGKAPIGEKRNQLIAAVHKDSKYLAFVDDDDLISNDYIKRVLDAIKTEPDCVGIEGTMTTEGRNPKKFIHSLKYLTWFEKEGIYYRNPNHLNPVKVSIAKQVSFPLVSHGEDHSYSKSILPLLKTEVYLEKPVYIYDYRPVKK